MVTKTPTGYSIEITTGLHPANDYIELVNDIITALQNQNQEVGALPNYYLLKLLRDMMPTYDQAVKMFD